MLELTGRVITRFGYASGALAPLAQLIGERIGIPAPYPGTLNVQLLEPYLVIADAIIAPPEYNGIETLKLKRCRVRGLRCCIMRPDSHETSGNLGATALELMSPFRLRDRLVLSDEDELVVEVDGDDAWWNSSEGTVAI